jgi:hypothetical protein
MNRHSWVPALLLAPVLALFAPAAQACDCVDPGPPCRAFAGNPVVFAARVTEIGELRIRNGGWLYRLVRFDLEESFLGAPQKSIEVTTGGGAGDCGFLFRIGERYLVDASDAPHLGRLYTGICGRTKLLSQAGVDLDFFRRRRDPGRGAGVEGTILELHRDPKTNEVTTKGMMKGVRVVVEGSGKSWDATTDDQGWFRVWGLPSGAYTVRAVLPRNFVADATTSKVFITPAECGWLHMLATPYPFRRPKH